MAEKTHPTSIYIYFDFYTMTYLARTSTYPIESFVLFAIHCETTCKWKFFKTNSLVYNVDLTSFFFVYMPQKRDSNSNRRKKMNSKWKWLRDFSNLYALTLKASQKLSTCNFQLSKPICRQLNSILFLFFFFCSVHLLIPARTGI